MPISRTRALRIVRLIRREQDITARRLSAGLRSLFRKQGRYATAVFLDEPVKARHEWNLSVQHFRGARRPPHYKNLSAAAMIPPGDDEAMFLLARQHLGNMVVQVGAIAAELVGSAPIVADTVTHEALVQKAGRRLRNVNSATRRAIASTLADGFTRGFSPTQIAQGVPDEGFTGLRSVVQETYKGRAETIARTESAIASQEAASNRYAAAGVTHVEIEDGPGCGWTRHDDGDIAHGSIRTLGAVNSHPISHPNCVRVSLPVLPS